MTTISQARLGKWFEDFRAKNVAEGIEQGRTLAHEEGATRLRRQAELKFGDAVAKRLADLLGGKPTASELDRVGAWLIECASGEELLSRTMALRSH